MFCSYVYIPTPHASLVLSGDRRGHYIPWNWHYKQLWANTSILGFELKYAARTRSGLNNWAISPAPKSVPKLEKPAFDGVSGLQQLDNVRKQCLLAETQMFPRRTAPSFLTIICWQCCGESIKWNSSYASVSRSKASLECCALAEHHTSFVDFYSRVVLMTMLSTEIWY